MLLVSRSAFKASGGKATSSYVLWINGDTTCASGVEGTKIFTKETELRVVPIAMRKAKEKGYSMAQILSDCKEVVHALNGHEE
ncbi:hypothetical protein AAC387_Pa03g2350 [Persea americana]